MVEKLPQKFRTDDGKMFETEADAKKHEEFDSAKSDYEQARAIYATLLWESQKTADGHQFNLTAHYDYFTIIKTAYSPPRLRHVNFAFYNCEFNEADEMVILVDEDEQETRHRYRISELYHDAKTAHAALREALLKYIHELQDEADTLAP